MAYTFFMAMASGFAVAAPIGPVSVVCARYTLCRGAAAGFAGGLGAAFGDALFGGLAGLGVTLVAAFLAQHAAFLSVLGGLALMGLGCATMRAPPEELAPNGAGGTNGHRGMFMAAFLLTIANPLTFLAFLALFAWLGINAAQGGFAGALLVTGVFLGALTWWTIWTSAVAHWRQRRGAPGMRRINQVSGLAIVGFGGTVALRAAWMMLR